MTRSLACIVFGVLVMQILYRQIVAVEPVLPVCPMVVCEYEESQVCGHADCETKTFRNLCELYNYACNHRGKYNQSEALPKLE